MIYGAKERHGKNSDIRRSVEAGVYDEPDNVQHVSEVTGSAYATCTNSLHEYALLGSNEEKVSIMILLTVLYSIY